MYKAIIAIGIIAAACVVAGCGSSEETAEAAVTKAEFIKQAEAICDEARYEARNAEAAWEKAEGKRLDFATALRQVIGPALQQEAEELQSLTVPKEDEAKLTRMFGNLSKGATAFAAEGLKSKSTLNYEAFKREAEAYGLGACRF
jgi:hypothetical protein